MLTTLGPDVTDVNIQANGLFSGNEQISSTVPGSLVASDDVDLTLSVATSDLLKDGMRFHGSKNGFSTAIIQAGSDDSVTVNRIGREDFLLVINRKEIRFTSFDKLVDLSTPQTRTLVHSENDFRASMNVTLFDARDPDDRTWGLTTNGLEMEFKAPEESFMLIGTDAADRISYTGRTDVGQLNPSFKLIAHTGFGDDTINFADFGLKTEVNAGPGADNIQGGQAHDIITAEEGADIIQGNAGDDRIFGNEGADEIDGGLGDDTIVGGDDGDIVMGGEGNDVLSGLDGPDTIFGGAGNDEILGGDGRDTIDAGPGNDTVNGNEGIDTISGGDGDDTLRGSADNDTINGGPGNDLIEGGGDNDVLNGDAGDDTITGIDGIDEIRGGSGNDSIDGGKGNDFLEGGEGNDVIHGGGGEDHIAGGAGNDDLSGGDQNDVLLGGSGDDTLSGGKGNDLLQGIAGNNTLRGDKGEDVLQGGTGNDNLEGGGNDDRLEGGDGNDFLADASGNDSLFGGNGDDVTSMLVGGNDIADGGSGTNVLTFESSKKAVELHVSLFGVAQEIKGRSNTLVMDNFSAFVGSPKNDVFRASLSSGDIEVDGGGNKKAGDIVEFDAEGALLNLTDEADGAFTVSGTGTRFLFRGIEEFVSFNTPPGVGGSVHGRHFADTNGNGLRDNGENYASGIELQLVDPATGEVVAQVPAMDVDHDGNGEINVTEETGIYGFTKARPGTFDVRQVSHDEWLSTEAMDEASILAYELDTTLELHEVDSLGGNVKWLAGNGDTYFVTIHGTVLQWDEVNADSPTGNVIAQLTPVFYNHPSLLSDALEPADTNVHWRPGESIVDLEFGSIPLQRFTGRVTGADVQKVTIYDQFGDFVATTMTESRDENGDGHLDATSESGWYSFGHLLPGEYTVQVEDAETATINLPAEPYSVNQVDIIAQAGRPHALTIELSEDAPNLSLDAMRLQQPNNQTTNNLSALQVGIDDQGRWTIAGLESLITEPGTYQLEVNMYELTSIVGSPLQQPPLVIHFDIVAPETQDLPGDTNRDGSVQFDDFLAVAAAFGSTEAFWEDGDFNGDGSVDFVDFLLLSDNFGSSLA